MLLMQSSGGYFNENGVVATHYPINNLYVSYLQYEKQHYFTFKSVL